MFFLFSDLLIYATTVPADDMYIMPRQFPLENVAVSNVEDNDVKKLIHAFSITSNAKSFIVLANDVETKQDWMETIISTKQSLPTTRQHTPANRWQSNNTYQITKNQMTGSNSAPIWTPDDEAALCLVCHAEFTMFFRKHHCRKCGSVVCGTCSTQKIVLEGRGSNPLRVCDNCFPKQVDAPFGVRLNKVAKK